MPKPKIKISVIVQTARLDFPILKRPDLHLFAPTLRTLESQTFPHKEFELILSDSRWEQRKGMFSSNEQLDAFTFPIKHIPVYSKWKDMGYWHAQANVNQGLIEADGELIILSGDCGEFPPNSLQKFWDLYQEGYFASAFVNYIAVGSTIEREMLNSTRPDHRYQFLKGENRWFPMGQQVFGYNSYSMDAILECNGADELFDGDKALGDCDTAMRLERASYKHIMDKDLAIYEHHHYGIPKEILFGKQYECWKYNYSLIILSDLHKRIRANDYTLSDEDMTFMRTQAENMEINWKFNWDNPIAKFWKENPPLFNLKELREKRLNGERITYRW